MPITLPVHYFGKFNSHHDGEGRFSAVDGTGVHGGDSASGGLDTFAQAWHQSLTGKEKQALKSYTSAHFDHVNSNLRHPDPVFSSAPSYKERISHIDEAINKSKLQEPLVLYRGIGGKSGSRLASLQTGSKFADKAYVSSSMDKAIAEKFSGDSKVVIRMTVPAGHSAAVLKDFSKYPHEKEVLLPRNAKFEVTGSEKVGAYTYLDVKVK